MTKPGTQFVTVNVADFLVWYMAEAEKDARMVWDKTKEYGGFEAQADYLELLSGRGKMGQHTPPEAIEKAIAFNCAQKLARIAEALSRGVKPSEDSWRDLGCYAMIARRLRVTRIWPA